MDTTIDAMLASAAGRSWSPEARWITGPGPHPSNCYRYFRTEFDLGRAPPAGVRLFITAATRYRLYLNGHLLGHGPAASAPHLTYYDEHDLAPRLAPGPNCLGVIVYHLDGRGTPGPCLLAELVDGDEKALLSTNASWQTAVADAWSPRSAQTHRGNRYAPYQELCDGRRLPMGWSEPGFGADHRWGPAEVVGGRTSDRPGQAGPWSVLVPRPIPMMREMPVRPEAVVAAEESTDIRPRPRGDDLAFALSAPGVPLERATVTGAENLVTGVGPAVFCCSTDHQDREHDGRMDPCVLLDLGQVRNAFAELEVEGPPGARVVLGWAERLVDGHFQIAGEGGFADAYTLGEGRQTWRAAQWRCGRYLRLRVQDAEQPVTVHALRLTETGYPLERRGRFVSSDKTLDGVFEISRRTIELCCHDGIFDTPWREAAQWLGDVAAVSVPGLHAAFGETRLPEKFLRQAAANQQATGLISNVSNAPPQSPGSDIPDYSLWWVHGLWEQYQYTGDAALLFELYPSALRIVQAHLPWLRAGLATDVPHWVFIDWADTDRRGACAAYNALLCHAAECAAKIAALRGDAVGEALCRRVAEGIRGAFHQAFWCPERGCYADANIDGTLSPKTSEHANYAALRFGLCDEATAGAVIERMTTADPRQVTEAQPFFMVVVLEALRRWGRTDLALELIRRRWGGRMLARGATSCFEEWYDSGSWRSGAWAGFLRTHSHAWSACPAEFLVRQLAGIEIIEPGCRAVRVAPAKVDFDYEARFPTPLGELTVRCQGGAFSVAAPDAMRVETVLPA